MQVCDIHSGVVNACDISSFVIDSFGGLEMHRVSVNVMVLSRVHGMINCTTI